MKQLLALAGVCALSFGCARTPASSEAPTAAGAKTFLDTVSETNLTLGNQASQAGWVQQTFITDDTEAISARASQAANETRDRPCRTEAHAPEKRRLRGDEGAPERPERAPLSVRPVIALGIIERIGQILVPMMGEMGGAVDRIGKP